MKPWLVALFVAVAFAGGILAGGSLLAEREGGPPPVAPSGGPAAPTGPSAPQVALAPTTGGPTAPTGTPAPTAPGAHAPAPATPAPAGVQPFDDAPPPTVPAPPPPPPDALAEGQRAAQDAANDDGKNGRVTHLVYDFDSEEERQAWEERRRASWQKRLQREREIKVRIMREKCGLTDAQEPVLVAILEAEAAERQRLVDALAAGTMSRTTFDEQVRQNVASARQELARLLTPAQLEAYQQLAPREQVLRDEAH